MASVINASMAAFAMSAGAPDDAQAPDCFLTEMFGEFFWIVVGFAAIRLLGKLNLLPELKLNLLAPPKGGKDKLGGKRRHAVPEAASLAEARKGGDAAAAAAPRSPTSSSVATAEARAHAVAIREALRTQRLGVALARMVEMRDAGFEVPRQAVVEMLQLAMAASASQEACDVLAGLAGFQKMPMDAVATAIADCLRRDDIARARALEKLAFAQQAPVPFGVYENLLKIYAKADQERASDLFKEMLERGFFASEGLCGSLMARSGEARNLAFTETVADYLRGKKMMTLATFKTLMKAYASNGMYEKACDLHEEILAAGVEPDSVMVGCLVKFATRCCRAELAKTLQARAQADAGDLHTFIALARTAGRDGDVAQAIRALRQAEDAHPTGIDAAIYNCTLDACVNARRMDVAGELMAEISQKGVANRITYNTLVKGHCAAGDLVAARRVMKEMASAGVAPDSASYNCILGFVADDSCQVAFDVLREMERKGVPMDHYTMSIMMKVAKKARDPRDAARALEVLDRASGVSVAEDEVLLNTVLDACITRKDLHRLRAVTAEFAGSNKVSPSVHTYGLLIKAFSMLKQPERCQALWADMVQTRGLIPTSIATSCMLDALCCCGRVEEAVALLKEWKERVQVNTVMYSTLIKGFASAGDPARAMDMCRELHAEGLRMNLVAYTALIDAHARTGKMVEAMAIFKKMQDEHCEPNIITYSALVKGYCLQGDMDEALRLFSSMLGKGLTADAVIFNTLLDGCVKHSRFELADELLATMEEHAVEATNFTMSIVVKLRGKQRRLDKAFDAVRERARDRRGRHLLDAQVASSLISACFHNHVADRALDAFEEIKSWPGLSEPDAAIHSALISGLSRHGDCRRAAALAAEACEATIIRRSSMKPLSAECLQLLFKGLRQQGLYAELGAALEKQLRLARMSVPDVTRLEPTDRRRGGR